LRNYLFLQLQVNTNKIECPKENESIYLENIKCSLYRSGKGSTLLDGHVDLLVPFNYAYIHVYYVYLKTNTSLQDLKFEWCSSFTNLPAYVHVLFGFAGKYSNNLFHACPYVPRKHIAIENCPLDLNPTLLSIFNYQLGNYKTGVTITDKDGKLIFFLNLYSSISRKRTQKGSKSG